MQLKIVAALEITRDIPRGAVEVVLVQVVEEMMAKLCATAATGSYSWQKHMWHKHIPGRVTLLVSVLKEMGATLVEECATAVTGV